MTIFLLGMICTLIFIIDIKLQRTFSYKVLDYWWSKDAPNCYRKEIVALLSNETGTAEASAQTGAAACGEEEEEESGPVLGDDQGASAAAPADEPIGTSPSGDERKKGRRRGGRPGEEETSLVSTMAVCVFTLFLAFAVYYRVAGARGRDERQN